MLGRYRGTNGTLRKKGVYCVYERQRVCKGDKSLGIGGQKIGIEGQKVGIEGLRIGIRIMDKYRGTKGRYRGTKGMCRAHRVSKRCKD